MLLFLGMFSFSLGDTMGEVLALPWRWADAFTTQPLDFDVVEADFLLGSCACFLCSVEAAAARAASGHEGLLLTGPPLLAAAAAPEAATGGVGTISVRR